MCIWGMRVCRSALGEKTMLKLGFVTVALMSIGIPGANGHHAIIPNFDLDQEIVLADGVVTELK